jgi:hypothetical protein
MQIIQAAGQALAEAFDMFWEVLWPLVLGFGLSAIVRGVRFVHIISFLACPGAQAFER